MSQAGFGQKGSTVAGLETLTGNSGGPVPGAGSPQNINIIGAEGVNIVGDPGTSTLTVSLTGGSAAIDSFQPNSGTNPVVPDVNGLVVLVGAGSITTIGSLNTLTTQLTGLTNHSLQVGAGTATLTQLGVATNGQLPIGSAGADPVLAALTAGSNISITNGAGSITIAANAQAQVNNYVSVNHAASPYLALATDYYISCDVTAGVITVQLPNGPTTGRTFVIKDKVGLSNTSNITITTVGGAVLIDGATTSLINVNYGAKSVLFNGTSYEVF